jgi:hypothetical protein
VALSATDPARVALIAPDRPDEVARRVGEAMARFCQVLGSPDPPNLDPRPSEERLEAICREALAIGCMGPGR